MNRMDNIVQRMIGTFRYLLNLEEPPVLKNCQEKAGKQRKQKAF